MGLTLVGGVEMDVAGLTCGEDGVGTRSEEMADGECRRKAPPFPFSPINRLPKKMGETS